MQQMSFRKQRWFIGAVALGMLAAPGCSRKPEPAPKPESTPAPQSTSTSTPSASSPDSNAASYVALGVADGSKGDLKAAIEAFGEAIRINPKFAPAYYNRGIALELQNKPDEAISDYDQVVQIDPSYREAYNQRGGLRGEKGDFDGALSDFDQVIKLDPSNAPAYYNRGHVLYFQGKLDNALTEINHALSLDPNHSSCYFIRGLIHHAQGHQAEALADFQKSAGFNFDYAALWVWISEMENGQRDLATKDLSDALTKNETFHPGAWTSQIASFLLGKITQDQLLAQAKTDAATPADVTGRLCEAWFYIGESKRFVGDKKGAQEAFANSIATGSKGSEEFAEAGREAAKL